MYMAPQEDPRLHRHDQRRRRRNFSLDNCHFTEQPEDFSAVDSPDGRSVLMSDDVSDSDSDSPPTSSRSPKRRRLHQQSSADEFHWRRLPELKARLSRLLEAAAGSTARVDILKRSLALPAGLLDVVAAHVAQEAGEEPRGLGGCVLHVFFEGRHDRHTLGSLRCDEAGEAPSFEIRLTLREGRWAAGGPAASSRLEVGTSYRLVKRRKY